MHTYAVVVHFDSDTTHRINKFIRAISRATGNSYMIDTNITPHITIGCFNAWETDRLIDIVKEIIDDIKTDTIEFDEIKAFEPRVLFLSPKRNAYLTEFNERVYEAFYGKFKPGENGYYIPEHWIPHCALACKMEESEIKRAKIEAESIELPMTAKVTGIALAECNPYKEIYVCPLQ